ncbi:MAG: hypothetical protein FJ117_04755 [Deltaproteobacteria bacterium]|nr:hypothetical protein [Deltaproteobacteria bacterium]
MFGGGERAFAGERTFTPVDSLLLNAMPGLKNMSSIFWTFATHAIEAKVDIETGLVKVFKVAAAHDS